MTSMGALLVWSSVGDPLPRDYSRLYNALSIAGLDVDHDVAPGVVMLRQTVEQAQGRSAELTGWSLYAQEGSQ